MATEELQCVLCEVNDKKDMEIDADIDPDWAGNFGHVSAESVWNFVLMLQTV